MALHRIHRQSSTKLVLGSATVLVRFDRLCAESRRRERLDIIRRRPAQAATQNVRPTTPNELTSDAYTRAPSAADLVSALDRADASGDVARGVSAQGSHRIGSAFPVVDRRPKPKAGPCSSCGGRGAGIVWDYVDRGWVSYGRHCKPPRWARHRGAEHLSTEFGEFDSSSTGLGSRDIVLGPAKRCLDSGPR